MLGFFGSKIIAKSWYLKSVTFISFIGNHSITRYIPSSTVRLSNGKSHWKVRVKVEFLLFICQFLKQSFGCWDPPMVSN